MPQAFRRAPRPKAFLAPLLLLLATSGCVSLALTESTKPFPGRQWLHVPTIAVAEARDRRPDTDTFGRVGWNSIKLSGDAGAKFRNALMTSLNEHAYNIRFVGNVNVLDPAAVAAAVREAKADFLLTAAVLDIRVFSVDPFFDPADVDFTAQVNLLDPDGRTRYTRHIHVHEDRRLWFNPAFGARDMLDKEMERVADFVATDVELVRVVSEPRKPPASLLATQDAAPAAPAPGEKPISSTEPAPTVPPTPTGPPPTGPVTTVPLSEIPEAPLPGQAPSEDQISPAEQAVPADETPSAEATAPTGSPPAEEAASVEGGQGPLDAPLESSTAEAPTSETPPAPDEPPAPEDSQPPAEVEPPEAEPSPQETAPPDAAPPEGTIGPDEEIVPPPDQQDPVFVVPGEGR